MVVELLEQIIFIPFPDVKTLLVQLPVEEVQSTRGNIFLLFKVIGVVVILVKEVVHEVIVLLQFTYIGIIFVTVTEHVLALSQST